MKKERPPFARDLAAAVRKRRRALRLTQLDLARLAGCGVDFLYDLENGKPTIRLDKLAAVLVVVGLRLSLDSGKPVLRVHETLQ